MTLNELKQLELPVTLKCFDGNYNECFREITVKSFNNKCMLIVDYYGGEDYMFVRELKHYKVKKKEITIDIWINVYEKGNVGGNHSSRAEADKAARYAKDRLDCINIKKTYEL